jgi:hypothetical protein
MRLRKPSPSGIVAVIALFFALGGTAIAAHEAECPAGSRAVSGGGFASIAGLDDSEMETSHTSWFILISNKTGITLKINASVECAGAGQAVAASVRRPTHARRNQRVAELTAEVAASKK